MVYKSVVIASMLTGLFAGTADAGCFGNRPNRCRSAPVVCAPCTPALCSPVICNPCNVQPQCFGGTAVMSTDAGSQGFQLAPGETLVPGSVRTVPRIVSSNNFDVQRFLRDLLRDRLITPPGINKSAVINGQVNDQQLDEILQPYRIN